MGVMLRRTERATAGGKSNASYYMLDSGQATCTLRGTKRLLTKSTHTVRVSGGDVMSAARRLVERERGAG